MLKIDQFTYNGHDLSVKYTETQTVKDGVECDIYEFSGDDSRDLAIVRVQKGFSTPRQLVVKGDQTFEGFISGKAVLSVHDSNGLHVYTFPNNEYSEVVVLINQTMQWTALEDLVFYEICRPPYEEGRFKNLF